MEYEEWKGKSGNLIRGQRENSEFSRVVASESEKGEKH
jgi:hypothetical protein